MGIDNEDTLREMRKLIDKLLCLIGNSVVIRCWGTAQCTGILDFDGAKDLGFIKADVPREVGTRTICLRCGGPVTIRRNWKARSIFRELRPGDRQ